MEGIEYHVRAILETQGATKALSKMDKFAAGFAKRMDSVERAGRGIAGNTTQIASSLAMAAGSAALLGGAIGMGAAVAGAIKFNAELESTQYSMASTLQLMDHSATVYENAVSGGMSAANAAAQQFNANLAVGEQTMDNLFRIAAKSPASFGQATQMFKNMLPGARSVTGEMSRIEELAKNSLALGMIMGGDFQTTGAQMSRILTGGAGAEFETWKVLQKSILEAGKSMEYFDKELAMGTKLTEKFNKLSPDQRLLLVEKATKKLGVATEAYGGTWAGLTSTLFSDIQLLQKQLGKGAFEKLKESLKGITGTGGALDPQGKVMQRLEGAANALGARIGEATERFASRVGPWIEEVSNNWPDIFNRAQEAFATGLKAAKLFLKVVAARAILGGGIVGIGKVGKAGAAAYGAGKGIVGGAKMLKGLPSKLADLVFNIGMAAVFAGPSLFSLSGAITALNLALAPFILLIGGLLVGAVGAAVGVVAYFVENWDSLVSGVNNGTISLAPLLNALDAAWNGFVAVGNALVGGGVAGEATSSIINLMASALDGLVDVIAFGLLFVGSFEVALNVVTGLLKAVGSLFVGILSGILGLLSSAVQYIPGLEDLSTGISKAGASAASLAEDWRQSGKDDFLNDSMDFMRAGMALQDRQSSGSMMKKFANYQAKANAKAEDEKMGTKGGAKAEAPGAPKGSSTNIAKVVINQDLRNQNPDRVIGAFYKGLTKAVNKRTQSTRLPQGGV